MRSEWVSPDRIKIVLEALTPPNRLACATALATGLRISDVLQLRTEDVRKSNRISIREQKTGKPRRVYLRGELREQLLQQAGSIYVFEGRSNGRQPRTRSAVYKDLKRAARAFRVKKQLSPHSLRKAWAVDALQRAGGDLQSVQKRLGHADAAVTMIYAMADRLTDAKETGTMAGEGNRPKKGGRKRHVSEAGGKNHPSA